MVDLMDIVSTGSLSSEIGQDLSSEIGQDCITIP